MKKLMKRTATLALAGTMAMGMLAGCGSEKAVDGTATVATVDGNAIPMGVVSLYARLQQAQTNAMYLAYFGSASNIWDEEADSETGETYGEQAVESVLEQVEMMYILKEKAADYDVEITEDDQTAIDEAAKAFMEANSEESIKDLAVTEDQVKTFLELETYSSRVYYAIRNAAEITVTDEEAQQSSFTYVKLATDSEDLTEDDIAGIKDLAQEMLDQMKEDSTADFDEVVASIDDSYTVSTGTFTTYPSEDESSSYPDEVLEVLRELEDGEFASDVIETDSAYYVVRLDEKLDQDATDTKRESLENTQRSDYYTETTDQWKEDADIQVQEKVLKTLKITDTHTFTIQTATADETEDEAVAEEDTEAVEEDTEIVEDEETVGEDAETVEDTDTEENTDAAEESGDEDDSSSEDTDTADDTKDAVEVDENTDDSEAEESTEE
jgi:trigger factor/foldase protein PrsA